MTLIVNYTRIVIIVIVILIRLETILIILTIIINDIFLFYNDRIKLHAFKFIY